MRFILCGSPHDENPILPVRVRTCAEGAIKTSVFDGGKAARAIGQPVVTKRPDSSTSGDVVSAGPSVRVSPLWTKHESSPLRGLRMRWMRIPSSARQVCGGVTRRKWFINSTGEVLRRRSAFSERRRGYKASSERALRRGGEENSPLLASSSRMSADPE